jgi:nitrous oxide reductase accessory protein NosL
MKLLKIVIAMVAVAAMATSGTSAEGMGMGNGMKKGMKMPKNYRMVPMAKAQILQDGKSKMYCPKCGMTLPMFYRTNHAATVDGKVQQFCSAYCLVEAMNDGAKISDVKVVDNSTLKFIDANKAFYVVGSSKPATMAKKISKYAFGTKEAAEKFAAEFGGTVMGYDQMLAGAKKDFESDTKAKKMRQAKGAQKGAMIYKKKCKPIEQKFASVAEAKSYIKANNVCGEIKGKALQGVGLYLMSR